MLLDCCVQGLVDMLHNPTEQLGIDVLGQGVPGIHDLLDRHVLDVGLGSGDQFAMAKPVLHLAVLHSQQSAKIMQVFILFLGYKGRHPIQKRMQQPADPIAHPSLGFTMLACQGLFPKLLLLALFLSVDIAQSWFLLLH